MARGSRKHVLDWTSRPNFLIELLQLVAPVECKLTAASQWMPQGHGSPREARLETFEPFLTSDVRAGLQKWWLAHEAGANTPNWDIAVGCEIEGKSGLILVEAKANVPEMSGTGKNLADDASERSADNHRRITEAVAQANSELRRAGAETSIRADRHYQLSNRVAFAWKLANLGVPTVLMYLGFTGDDGLREPFKDDQHWESEFGAYAYASVPRTTFGRPISCGHAPMWFLVRSRQVIESSPRGTSAGS